MTTAVAPLLIRMCGLSFSGKSTLALGLRSRLDAEVLSLDVINAERGLYGGQGISGEEWQKTHQIAQARALHALTGRRSVIIDDTASLTVSCVTPGARSRSGPRPNSGSSGWTSTRSCNRIDCIRTAPATMSWTG